MFEIIAALDQPIPMPYMGRMNKTNLRSCCLDNPNQCGAQIQQLKSVNQLAKNWTSQTSRSKFARLGMQTICTTKVCGDYIVAALGQTIPTSWHPSWHSNGGLSTIHDKTELVLSHPTYTDRLDMLARMARPATLMRCPTQARHTSNQALTRAEDHTKTHRTQNTALRKKKNTVGGRTIVVSTPGQKRTWWRTSSRSNSEKCSMYMRINAGRFPSSRIYANRETWSQSWLLDNPRQRRWSDIIKKIYIVLMIFQLWKIRYLLSIFE